MFCADTQLMYIIIADKKNPTYEGLNIWTKYIHTHILRKEQQKMCSQPIIDSVNLFYMTAILCGS